jgi:hypothetical protein
MDQWDELPTQKAHQDDPKETKKKILIFCYKNSSYSRNIRMYIIKFKGNMQRHNSMENSVYSIS